MFDCIIEPWSTLRRQLDSQRMYKYNEQRGEMVDGKNTSMVRLTHSINLSLSSQPRTRCQNISEGRQATHVPVHSTETLCRRCASTCHP